MTMKWVHIICGILSLLAGFTALFATKGSALHRRAGQVFVAAMLVMTSTGAFIAFLMPNRGSVVAGLLTFYMVSTSILTVRAPVTQTRALSTALMLMAFVLAAFGFAYGIEALNSPSGTVDKIPAPPLFLFGSMALLAGIMDVRLLRAGHIEGPHRLARHLWRMTFALWMAATSAFIGQAKFLPKALRETGLHTVPVLVVTLMLFFWLGRVYWKSRRRPAALARTATQAAQARLPQ
jgi:uncharacterized membrane protein